MIKDEIKFKLRETLRGEQPDFVVMSKATRDNQFKMDMIILIGVGMFFVPFVWGISEQFQQVTDMFRGLDSAKPKEILEKVFGFLFFAGLTMYLMFSFFSGAVSKNFYVVTTPTRLIMLNGDKVDEFSWRDFTGKTSLTKNKKDWQVELYLKASVGQRAPGRGAIDIYGVDCGPQVEQAIRYRISEHANAEKAF